MERRFTWATHRRAELRTCLWTTLIVVWTSGEVGFRISATEGGGVVGEGKSIYFFCDVFFTKKRQTTQQAEQVYKNPRFWFGSPKLVFASPALVNVNVKLDPLGYRLSVTATPPVTSDVHVRAHMRKFGHHTNVPNSFHRLKTQLRLFLLDF